MSSSIDQKSRRSGSCSALLSWDEQTYLPQDGASHRSGQTALLAGLHHERATDPKIGELLEMLEGSDWPVQVDSVPAINIRELRRTYDRRVRLPRTLVEELANHIAGPGRVGGGAFRRAISAVFAPGWNESSSSSERKQPALPRLPRQRPRKCQALRRQPGPRTVIPLPSSRLTTHYLTNMNLEPTALTWQSSSGPGRELVPLVTAITEAALRKTADFSGLATASNLGGDAVLTRLYPRDRQKIFGETVAAAIGFDFNRGAAGRGCTPVLHGHRARRLPDHHPIRRAPIQRCVLRRPARGRPRPLRAGARPRTLWNTDGRGRLAGRARVSIPAVGERGRARTGILGLTGFPWPSAFFVSRSPT